MLEKRSKRALGLARDSRAGFTLIELMIVVSIIGILAAVALPMMMSYVYKARTIEATSFLTEIRGRQESYRADFDQYCNVSASEADFYPTGTPGPTAAAWGVPPTNWSQLGAMPPGRQSIFRYAVVAGVPGTPSGFAASRGYNGSDFYFIALARGDLDGDGTPVTFELYSHSKTIFCDQTNGWE